MALSDYQKSQLNSYLNQLSAAELNQTLESQNNLRNWLYNNHRSLYDQVKDILDEVWNYSKKLAKSALKVIGYAAVGVLIAPFVILGAIFDS